MARVAYAPAVGSEIVPDHRAARSHALAQRGSMRVTCNAASMANLASGSWRDSMAIASNTNEAICRF